MLFALYPTLSGRSNRLIGFFHQCKSGHSAKEEAIDDFEAYYMSFFKTDLQQERENGREEQKIDSAEESVSLQNDSDTDPERRNYESDDFEFMDNNYFIGGVLPARRAAQLDH